MHRRSTAGPAAHPRPLSPRSLGRLLLLPVCLLALASPALVHAASAPEILRVRYFSAPSHTRVVLDLTGPATYETRRVGDPERLVVNVAGARFRDTAALAVADGLLRGVRRNAGRHRAQVVLDLDQRAEYRTFVLKATGGLPDRIVVDVLRAEAAPAVQEAHPQPAVAATPAAPAEPARPFTVVIDPGHGGMDPGAIRGHLHEKDVVLDIAREMARLIDGLPGYRAVLTRDGDYGLELWERVALATREDGDLFLSIHCNTHPRTAVAGMEVYFLSLQGATDREARELADKENAAALVGLAGGRDNDDLVMDILMDLRMSAVLHESSRLSESLLDTADRSGLVAGRKVKQAGFHVLKSLAMPSALVEVAYLSNPEDRRSLGDPAFRKRMAASLVEGALKWRRDLDAVAALGGSADLPWTRHYEVRRGDSLWELARRHGTTVTEISRHNDLSNRGIMVGQMLRLPEVGRRP